MGWGTLMGIFLRVLPIQALPLINPQESWQLAQQKPFYVVYPASQPEWASLIIENAQKAYEKLTQSGGFSPPERPIWIVVRPDWDISNGWATAIPWAQVVVLPFVGHSYEALADLNDWLYELLLHELTHIFIFENRSGWVKTLYRIFGSWVTPGLWVPDFFHEGLAVWAESQFSSGGRLRSPLWHDHWFWLAQNPNLSQQNFWKALFGDTPQWPWQHRPYELGSLWLIYWTGGLQSDTAFVASHAITAAGRYSPLAWPWLWDSINLDPQKAWEKLANSLQQWAQSRRNRPALNLTPVIPADLSQHWLEMWQPQLSPDGRYLLFLARWSTFQTGVVVFDRHHKRCFTLVSFGDSSPCQTTRFVWASGVTRAQLTIDGRVLLSVTIPKSPYRWASQPVWWDFQTQKWYLASWPLPNDSKWDSLKSAYQSPQGEVAFVVTHNGQQDLVVGYPEKRHYKVIFRVRLPWRLDWPVKWGPYWAFILKTDGWQERLVLWHSTQRKFLYPRFPKCALIRHLEPLSDNSLAFSCLSVTEGVWELVRWDGINAPDTWLKHQVGLYQGILDPVTQTPLIATTTDKGWGIFWAPNTLTRDPQGIVVDESDITPPSEEVFQNPTGLSENTEKTPWFWVTPEVTGAKPPPIFTPALNLKPYRPWHHWKPQMWIPWIQTQSGGWRLGAFTWHQDPLGQLQYSLTAGWDSGVNKPFFQTLIRYQWNRPWLLGAQYESFFYQEWYRFNIQAPWILPLDPRWQWLGQLQWQYQKDPTRQAAEVLLGGMTWIYRWTQKNDLNHWGPTWQEWAWLQTLGIHHFRNRSGGWGTHIGAGLSRYIRNSWVTGMGIQYQGFSQKWPLWVVQAGGLWPSSEPGTWFLPGGLTGVALAWERWQWDLSLKSPRMRWDFASWKWASYLVGTTGVARLEYHHWQGRIWNWSQNTYVPGGSLWSLSLGSLWDGRVFFQWPWVWEMGIVGLLTPQWQDWRWQLGLSLPWDG